jgi:hypothetical protein
MRWVLAVLSIGLGASCADASPPPCRAPTVSMGSGGQPGPAVGLPSAQAFAAPPAASRQEDEAGARPPEPDASPRPEALVVTERPYKLFERPRARGPVQAAVEDEDLGRWNVGGTGDPDFISNRPSFHPGARVIVELDAIGRPGRNRGRSPSPERRYLAQARKHGYWPFRLCFEEGLRQNPKLHGKTELRLSVDQLGRSHAVRLVATRLDDQAVAACLRDRVRELVFSPPTRAELRVSVELWPGDAPIEPAPPSSDTARDNPGELDPEALLAVVRSAQPELVGCYERGLVRDPQLWGRLELRFDQDERGRLGRLGERQSHFPDRKTALCVVEALRSLSWPRPSQGRLSWVLGLRFGHPPRQSKDND